MRTEVAPITDRARDDDALPEVPRHVAYLTDDEPYTEGDNFVDDS